MTHAGAPGQGTPTRILLFTGKGGVGKTTAAAAIALQCADAGLRTLALSTDPAHSLGDAFDVALGPLVARVADGLWAQQLDAQDRMAGGGRRHDRRRDERRRDGRRRVRRRHGGRPTRRGGERRRVPSPAHQGHLT